MRIAVVGSGIAGLAASYGLADRHAVTLYEAEPRLGGHTATVDIDYDGTPIAVDTGFIVYNTLNYPNLTQFFDVLGVETVRSDMSFSLSLGGGRFEWAGHDGKPWKLFAQAGNMVDLRFWALLFEVLRFNGVARADREAGRLAGHSLGSYLAARGFSADLAQRYLVPMGAAIWSSAPEALLAFPAESFVAFFDNHRLLSFDRPRWRTVQGGARRYVEALTARFGTRVTVRLGCPVVAVRRGETGVRVTDGQGATADFDQVVLACHADQSLALLADADEAERRLLSAVRFQPNEVVLHRDSALMPRRRAAWSSWNVFGDSPPEPGRTGGVAVTYWMNRLQPIPRRYPLFVTLNAPRPIAPEHVFGRFVYEHPVFDTGALAAQRALGAVQGRRGTWFAGAWTGYGFHEDGFASGLSVAEALGGRYPWRAEPRAAPPPPALQGEAA